LRYFEKHKQLPDWFNEFGDLLKPVPVPHYTKFYVINGETNVKLAGSPDEIFQKEDGSFCIIDYKTAKFTSTQDELLPMYEMQLN